MKIGIEESIVTCDESLENNLGFGINVIVRIRGFRLQIKIIFFEHKNFYQYFFN
jgi:hypothetical protein